MKMPWYRDREWKVKWKCLKIEIESEKWIENASRSRSRSEISREFSRNSWESRNQENLKFCYKCFSFRKLLLWNTTKCYFWINMSQGILGMVLGWDMAVWMASFYWHRRAALIAEVCPEVHPIHPVQSTYGFWTFKPVNTYFRSIWAGQLQSDHCWILLSLH